MAALSDPMAAGPEIVDLRHLSGRELDPLLLEETVEWQRNWTGISGVPPTWSTSSPTCAG